MKVLLAWCSRTGTTARVAAAARAHLEELGHAVTEAPIAPRWDLPYPLWLALSFLPGSRARLQGDYPDPGLFHACLLALPKWTFSCPPVNGYLARFGARLPPTAVLVTCGGWDQERYLEALQRDLAGRGVPVLGGWTVRRKAVEGDAFAEGLQGFLHAAFGTLP